VSVTGIQPVGTANIRSFDLSFATNRRWQLQLILAPISRPRGNPMNQIANAVNGEPLDDQYHARFTLSDVLIYQATDVRNHRLDLVHGLELTIDQDVTSAMST